jgi:hypothetical protein
MGSAVLIIPILAFSFWLLATTGRRTAQRAVASRNFVRLALVVIVGAAIGWLFATRVEYKMGATLRLHSFPIPSLFIYLQDEKWVNSPLPEVLRLVVYATDFLCGFTIPFFPFKIGEFFREVKEEL